MYWVRFTTKPLQNGKIKNIKQKKQKAGKLRSLNGFFIQPGEMSSTLCSEDKLIAGLRTPVNTNPADCQSLAEQKELMIAVFPLFGGEGSESIRSQPLSSKF